VAGRAAHISARMGVPLSRRNEAVLQASPFRTHAYCSDAKLINQEVVVRLIILLAVGFIFAKLEGQGPDSDL